MPEPTSHLGLYRAGLTSPAHRQHITVARAPLVQDTLEILRGSMSRNSKHHFLFIGPRGIGKTHLLSLIEDEIAAAPDLTARYVVARFPEESHRTLSFADFLLGLCEILGDTLPDEPLWRELHQRVRTQEDDTIIVDTLVPALRRQNRERGRTVLVMLENLGEVFTRQIKKKNDIAALRKFFMDDNGCLLVATAPLHFDAITSVEEPFYDFFDVQILESLSETETLDLIRRNLEWERRDDLLDSFDSLRPKLLALYRMTGGNPRLIVMLYELIAHDAVTEVRQQFQILLDRITPFYQSRLNDLPPQERAVLETMAVMRDQEKTPAAITARMRLSQPQTSSLLKRLTEACYLRAMPHPQDKRSRLYTIREGFFDIWLAMNLSRGARERLPFLLNFFTLYYPTIEERDRKRAELRARRGDGDAEQALDYLSEVGPAEEKAVAKLDLARWHAGCGTPDKAVRYLREASSLPLDPLGTWIVRHVDDAPSTDYLNELREMIDCWELHRSGNLEAFAERFGKLANDTLNSESFSETKISFLRDHLHHITGAEGRVEIRLRIANLLHYQMTRWQDAEQEFRLAENEAEALDNPLFLVIILNNLALLLKATGRLAEAELLLRRALAIDGRNIGPGLKAILIDNLAKVLQETNRLTEAESLIRQVLAIDEKSLGPDHPGVVIRLNNLASLLQDTNRLAEAEPLMCRALAIDEHSFGPDHPNVAIDLNNLAQLFQDTNRLAEAEPLMRRALNIFLDFTHRTGHEHPHLHVVQGNYVNILKALGRSETDIDADLWKLRAEHGIRDE